MVSFNDIEMADDTSLSCMPHLFQEQVEKKYEIRVISVGNKIFAFKILSQDKDYTITDWRYGNYTLKFIECTIPSYVINKIHDFKRFFDLHIGHFDIILSEGGEYWFLECNQDGQWGWLDDLVDGKIADAFADEFIRLIEENNSEYSSINKIDPFSEVRRAHVKGH